MAIFNSYVSLPEGSTWDPESHHRERTGTSGGKRIPNAVNFVHSLRTTVKNSDSTAYDYNAISGYAVIYIYGQRLLDYIYRYMYKYVNMGPGG
jgi:hypothetical protein